MLSPAEFHALISGRRRGKRAALWRMGLRAAEVPYTWAVRYRNRRYDQGHAEIHRVDVPVVSVGNLTLGGTGKTPMIVWLAERYRESGLQVGIVSRGYGSVDGQPNDEARELAKRLPDVPHVQDRDRVAGARDLLQQQGADILLLDDGFQHRRLHRDLDVVLIDALQPEGFGHVFPRGSLREPMNGLQRASVAILTRANRVSSDTRAAIRRNVQRLAPHVVWAEAEHRPTGLVNQLSEATSLESLNGKRVFAFCGIGNPEGFFEGLQGLGCDIVGRKVFPDHYGYEAADVDSLSERVRLCEAELAICTQKDLVKFSQSEMGAVPLQALQIEMAVTNGEADVSQMLRDVIQTRSASE